MTRDPREMIEQETAATRVFATLTAPKAAKINKKHRGRAVGDRGFQP